MFRGNEKGFTLIELMIVIAILGILAAVAVPNFLQARYKAQDAAGKTAITAAKSAIEMYAAETGSYNSSLAAIATSGALETEMDTVNVWPNNLTAGVASGNLCDAAVAIGATAEYQLMGVGRDATHTFIYTNSTNLITTDVDTEI